MLEEILIAVSYCVRNIDVDEITDKDFGDVIGEVYSVDNTELVGVIFFVDLNDGFVEACLVVSDSDVVS